MATTNTNTPSALIPHSALAASLGVHVRTLKRWVANASLNFPPAITINKRRYYDRATVDAWRDAQVQAAIAAHGRGK